MKVRQIQPLKFNTQNVQEPRVVYVLVKPYDICEKKYEEDGYEHHEDINRPKDKIRGSKLNFLA